MNTITLPPGNDKPGYVAIAVFKSQKHAATHAHATCLALKRSVQWDEFKDGDTVMGFAVWIATTEPKKPKPITHRGWTHVEVC